VFIPLLIASSSTSTLSIALFNLTTEIKVTERMIFYFYCQPIPAPTAMMSVPNFIINPPLRDFEFT